MATKTKDTLDRSKPFSVVRGGGDIRTIQDGKYYDFADEYVRDVDGAYLRGAAEAEPKAVAQRKVESNVDTPAKKVVGSLNLSSASPKVVEDAARENARARAAEDNA